MKKTSGRPTFIQVSRSVSAEEKALWHHVTGAGRSHVKREFCDLSDDDIAAIERLVDEGIDRLVAGGR